MTGIYDRHLARVGALRALILDETRANRRTLAEMRATIVEVGEAGTAREILRGAFDAAGAVTWLKSLKRSFLVRKPIARPAAKAAVPRAGRVTARLSVPRW